MRKEIEMKSIISEIEKIRGERKLDIDSSNSDRYCVVSSETDGTKSTYCFSTPIYNLASRRLVDLCFHNNGKEIFAECSNTKITLSDSILLESTDGWAKIKVQTTFCGLNGGKALFDEDEIFPTTNGIVYKARCNERDPFVFEMELSRAFADIRSNGKCFALMNTQFKPFISVSSIGIVNSKGEVIAPADISYQHFDSKKFRIIIIPRVDDGEYLLFEINMHEPKLIQDTTVESLYSKMNNAFGTTAFIGKTERFGEQWLYSKLDMNKIITFSNKRINRVILHIPRYNNECGSLSAFGLSARFCSFGSNWDNKVLSAKPLTDTASNNSYESLDITALLTDINTKRIKHSEGFILKSKTKNGFTVISTGDSCYSPQILEINYNS